MKELEALQAGILGEQNEILPGSTGKEELELPEVPQPLSAESITDDEKVASPSEIRTTLELINE